MSLARRTIQGVATVGVGQSAGQAMAFARNIIIARMLGPDQFGIAAAFAMTMSLLEMFSDLAVDRLITQAPDGNRRDMEATLHTLQVLRGLVTGAIIFAAAQPLAVFLEAPEAGWAFQWLALAPVLRGLRHLDPQRYQRRLIYRPAVWMDIASQAVALAVAWPLAKALGDYSVMLWVVLLQAAAFAVVSHVTSRRPYRLGWTQPIVRRAVAFGAPIVASGVLLGVIFHGDKFLVAGAYGRTELGLYAVAYSLAMVPSLVVAKVNSALALPLLAPLQHRLKDFCDRYLKFAQTLGAVSTLYAVGFIALGPIVLVTLYGADYAPAAGLVAVLGVRQAVRVLRAGPSQAAMALGETANVMIANIARVAALGLAIFWALQGKPLVWIAAAGLVGEVAGLLAAVIALRLRHAVPARLTLHPSLETAVSVLVVIGLLTALGDDGSTLVRVGLVVLVAIVLGGIQMMRLDLHWQDALPARFTATREGIS